jgi:hypothetical protein
LVCIPHLGRDLSHPGAAPGVPHPNEEKYRDRIDAIRHSNLNPVPLQRLSLSPCNMQHSTLYLVISTIQNTD